MADDNAYDPDARFKLILDRRIPLAQIELGRVYVIFARNGCVTVTWGSKKKR